MGIWDIHTYTVSPEKSEEHEEAMKQFVQYMQQNLPDIEFNYFRQRFGPLTRASKLINLTLYS